VYRFAASSRSPRWLLTHGRGVEAEQVVAEIEDEVRKTHPQLPEPEGEPFAIEQREHIGFMSIAKYVVKELSVARSARVVADDRSGLPGRKIMISFTYSTSGVLLIVTGLLFTHNVLSATTMTIAWSVIFFFASAAASAAYLTVSELLPMEARAMAIALFYAVGTGISAVADALRPADRLTKSRTNVNYGYVLGSALMIGAGLVAVFLAVAAERKTLEDIARPLTAVRARLREAGAVPARAR